MRWTHPAMAVAGMALSLAVAAEEPDALLIELPSVFRLPTYRHYAANFSPC